MADFDIFGEMKNADQVLLLLALQKDGTNAGQFIVEKERENGDVQTAHSVVIKTHDGEGFFDSVANVIGILKPKNLNVAVVAKNGVLAIVTDFTAEDVKPWVGDITHDELAGRLAIIEEGANEAGQPFENFLCEIEDLEEAPTKIMALATMKMNHSIEDLKEIVS